MEKEDTVHKQEKIVPKWLFDEMRNDGGQELMFIAQWIADISGCIKISDDDLININLTEEEKTVLSMSQSSKQGLGVTFLDPILVEKKKAILREIPNGEVGLRGDPALMDFKEIEGKELAIWSYRFADTNTLCFTLVQKGQEAPTWLKSEMEKDHGGNLQFICRKVPDFGSIYFSDNELKLINLTEDEKEILKTSMLTRALTESIKVSFLNPLSGTKKEAELLRNGVDGLVCLLMDFEPFKGKEVEIWSYRLDTNKLCFTVVQDADVANQVDQVDQAEVHDHHHVAPRWLSGEMDKDHGQDLIFIANKLIAEKSDSGFIWFSSVNELVNLTDPEKASLKERDGPLQHPIKVLFLNPISLKKKEAKLQQIGNRGIGLIAFPSLMDLKPIDGKEAAVWSYRMPDTKVCFTIVPKYDVPNIIRRTPQRHPFSYLSSLVRDLDDLPTKPAS